MIPEVVGGLDSKAVAERLGATQKLAPSVRADIECKLEQDNKDWERRIETDDEQPA